VDVDGIEEGVGGRGLQFLGNDCAVLDMKTRCLSLMRIEILFLLEEIEIKFKPGFHELVVSKFKCSLRNI